MTTNNIYERNEIMEELREQMEALRQNFDALLYYDKKALDKRVWEHEGTLIDARNMIKENFDIQTIMRITELEELDIQRLQKELETSKEQ